MIENFIPTDSRRTIFEKYKNIQASVPSKLMLNYGKWFNLDEQEMLTMYKPNEFSEPSIFSSIYRRDWWPVGAYRILNRTWQYPRVTKVEKTINDGLYEMIDAQLNWCKAQPNFKVAIISRNKNTRLFNKMQSDLALKGLSFYQGKKLWVCEGSESNCLQQILYFGDATVFDEWRLPCR